MFWSVGFLLTLAVQLFAHNLFDIEFRRITPSEPIAMEADRQLNLYIAALDREPDVERLRPAVTVKGANEQALSVETLSFGLTRPSENDEPIYAHGLYSVTTSVPQEVVVQWGNPQEGYFLAVSKSLMLPKIAFFTIITLALMGAAFLYATFGKKVLQRLTITQPAASEN